MKGSFKFSGSGVSQKKKDETENLLINNLNFSSNRLISKNGFVQILNFSSKMFQKKAKKF